MEKVIVLNKKPTINENGTVLAWDTGRSNASVYVVVERPNGEIALWNAEDCSVVHATAAAAAAATGKK